MILIEWVCLCSFVRLETISSGPKENPICKPREDGDDTSYDREESSILYRCIVVSLRNSLSDECYGPQHF